MTSNSDRFNIEGKVAVVTGGGGILGGAMALALARVGARVAILDLLEDAARAKAEAIREEGGEAISLAGNVLERESVEASVAGVVKAYGRVDILINGAGGNKKEATTSEEMSFFDVPADALRFVIDLNLVGSVLPSQAFGRLMVDQGEGCILNISSMCSYQPLTKVLGYSAAKAAINNFTQWLAVHIAQNYSPNIRVNAIAPGFFETAQNKFLLRDAKTNDLTPRGESIVAHTPMGRFGVPEDLMGTVLWLVSPASEFVTGVVVPIDGGFSAFSGV